MHEKRGEDWSCDLSFARPEAETCLRTPATERANSRTDSDTVEPGLGGDGGLRTVCRELEERGCGVSLGGTSGEMGEFDEDNAGAAGKLQTRRLDTAKYTTILPGVPAGDYVVLLFESSFEHKAVAQETVIVSREKDKVWRVAGYYIK